jgi:hypothetical protein
MACLSCGSECQSVFNAELALSFSGLEGVTLNPPVYMVLRAPVCLDCGYMDLRIPDGELKQLREGTSGMESKQARKGEPFRTAAT